MPEGPDGCLAAGWPPGVNLGANLGAELSPNPGTRTLAIRRAASRLCLRMGWSPLHEVPLPNGRRADILALGPGETIACIEVKSCERDFLSDRKWPLYRAFCDRLLFAVDEVFPPGLLPGDAGLIVACDGDAALLREAPLHRLAPARRRALLFRFAQLAAARLAAHEDPAGHAEARAALLVE